ncbi:hypothetical protein YC2023_051059 [Brassica napus]
MGPNDIGLDLTEPLTSGVGCKACRLELARRVSGRTGLGHGVNSVTLTGSSLARHVALPDHGVGLDGQSCSCLIVGWPVGLSSPTLGRFGGVTEVVSEHGYDYAHWFPCFQTFSIIFESKGVAISRKSGRVQSLGRGCCTGVVGWIFGVMEDFDVLHSPTLADLFPPQSVDQVVPDMITTPIIIYDDESDDVAVPAPIIIISDDDTESDDDVLEVPLVVPPSPITIWSTGTTGYDPAEDHGSSPPTPEVGTPSYGSPPLHAFELPISPMSPGLPESTVISVIDEVYELETGWLILLYQPMECIGDGEDDPLLHYPDGMVVDEQLTQPMESPYYHPIHEIGDPSIFPVMETDMTELPVPHTIQEIGDPSIFPTMETATTPPPYFHTIYETGGPSTFVPMEPPTMELPFHQTFYETAEPSSFPAAMGAGYAPRGLTSYGDPYATDSYYHGQGSDMFHSVGGAYLDPYGYPYHTMSYLGGPGLYSMCLVCGDVEHLAAICPRYVDLLEIPYLPCAQPGEESPEWGRCPNCSMLLYVWRL